MEGFKQANICPANVMPVRKAHFIAIVLPKGAVHGDQLCSGLLLLAQQKQVREHLEWTEGLAPKDADF